MIPLSTLNESFGSPAMCHSRIFTGSPSTPASEKDGDRGMFSRAHASTHRDVISSRYVPVNAPR
eukprot:3917-Pelagococcus_subviridis.AAC.4